MKIRIGTLRILVREALGDIKVCKIEWEVFRLGRSQHGNEKCVFPGCTKAKESI